MKSVVKGVLDISLLKLKTFFPKNLNMKASLNVWNHRTLMTEH